MGKFNISVIIPSLNPDEKLLHTVNDLLKNGFDDIIIINDGSKKEYLGNFPNTDVYKECTVLTHEYNRGKGDALKTAFTYFLENRKDKAGVVTIDADGQHLVKDIINCTDKMLETSKIVLGCRDFSCKSVPLRSRFGNKTTRILLRLLYGVNVSDTQTGLRAIPKKFLVNLLDIEGSRYEYETNMLLEFKQQAIDFCEVPIETVYINDNEASHFRPIVDSYRIYKKMFKFIFSSLSSMLIELVLFYLCIKFLFHGNTHEIIYSTAIARFFSSIYNFLLNRNSVFSKNNSLVKSLLRYIALAIVLILASGYSVKGLSLIIRTESELITTVLKIIVDTVLFFVSFRVQQNWVFAPGRKNKN
ncbi:MAG: bifunctional glycosyltransferase family 2/GtrA family protein [Clostridia bacterium]|nr:bifunctional glycosyltransferase family 2/GtrA family protein [Clostridia bacterium]